MVIGILLVVFGVAALLFQGVTYDTTERVAQAGPFAINVQKPHTNMLHPVVGIAALVGVVVMMMASSRAWVT
ncbi:MAG TPA: DUF3185 domain-containing protein [Gemmataceae bacterium]|nr:DUF3185 domain-containing protein [Gemmataceae bacterium]